MSRAAGAARLAHVMPENRTALATASFLDSTPAKNLADIDREDAKKIVSRFLGCCYDEIGKAPKYLDGQDMHAIVGHLMPGHFRRQDPLAASVEPVLSAYLDHLEETEAVSNQFELRRSLQETIGEFRHAVTTGTVHHHNPREKPFVHGADKTGRNDACPCGSGKKYKKCHGKAQ